MVTMLTPRSPPPQPGRNWARSSTPCLPEQVARTRERMKKLNPEFVGRAIAQLMIMPDYEASAADSLDAALAVLDEVLSSPQRA